MRPFLARRYAAQGLIFVFYQSIQGVLPPDGGSLLTLFLTKALRSVALYSHLLTGSMVNLLLALVCVHNAPSSLLLSDDYTASLRFASQDLS